MFVAEIFGRDPAEILSVELRAQFSGSSPESMGFTNTSTPLGAVFCGTRTRKRMVCRAQRLREGLNLGGPNSAESVGCAVQVTLFIGVARRHDHDAGGA